MRFRLSGLGLNRAESESVAQSGLCSSGQRWQRGVRWDGAPGVNEKKFNAHTQHEGVLQDHSLPQPLTGYICHKQRTEIRQAALPVRESSAAPVCINQLVLTAAWDRKRNRCQLFPPLQKDAHVLSAHFKNRDNSFISTFLSRISVQYQIFIPKILLNQMWRYTVSFVTWNN